MTHYVDTPTSPGTPARTGIRSSSVPSILLGLGALCLLVAAVIFLSVAWSRLGVGGRRAFAFAACCAPICAARVDSVEAAGCS